VVAVNADQPSVFGLGIAQESGKTIAPVNAKSICLYGPATRREQRPTSWQLLTSMNVRHITAASSPHFSFRAPALQAMSLITSGSPRMGASLLVEDC
jgi:hypothetical protein